MKINEGMFDKIIEEKREESINELIKSTGTYIQGSIDGIEKIIADIIPVIKTSFKWILDYDGESKFQIYHSTHTFEQFDCILTINVARNRRQSFDYFFTIKIDREEPCLKDQVIREKSLLSLNFDIYEKIKMREYKSNYNLSLINFECFQDCVVINLGVSK